MLRPIVVDYFGRDGSTAMLKILSSSPLIVVPGSYPFEEGNSRGSCSLPMRGRHGPPTRVASQTTLQRPRTTRRR